MNGYTTVFIYAVICLVYIFWSDSLLFYFVPDLEQTRYLQSFKGALFVLITAALLAYLIRRHNIRHQRIEATLQESLRESKELTEKLRDAMLSLEASRNSLETQSADLQRSNKDLAQFAYVVSHDLQEPLRMVTSYLQLLERRYTKELDDDAREFINFAVDGAHRMQAQIRSLLDYSRLNTRAQEFTEVDLHKVLKDVLQNLSLSLDEKSVELCVGEVFPVQGDAVQLSLLFQNVLSNAIKHGTKENEAPRIEISCSEKDNEYLFCIEDNGPGFEQHFADRIFEVFQRLTRDEDGTGIGLALCKRIVERHGGRIWAESSPGEGTCIFFTLPRSA